MAAELNDTRQARGRVPAARGRPRVNLILNARRGQWSGRELGGELGGSDSIFVKTIMEKAHEL